MTIYDLKPGFQNLLRPICISLAGAGVTANQVTIAALLLSLLVGGVFALFPASPWAVMLLPAWLIVRMALNAIDGMLAREHAMQSALGGILNELGDVVADTALYLPLALLPGLSPLLVVIVVITAILTEMAGVVAVQVGASRRYDGPMGKSDRAFVFGLLALLFAVGIDLHWWANALLAVVAMLSLLTVVNRSSKALREIAARSETDPN